MKVLLDTHALLWILYGDPRLSKRASELVSRPDIQISLSIASLWEIAIKTSLGKLTLGRSYGEFVQEFILARPISIVPISVQALIENERLPWHHRDPFDRIIIAESVALNIPVVSSDQRFTRYNGNVLW